MKDPIEQALEELQPAEMPPALMARLTAARPQPSPERARLWRRWLFPLAAAACAAAAALAYLDPGDAPPPASLAAAEPMPFERHDYLLETREMGVVIAPNHRPYRVLEINWLEQDTIRPSAAGPAVRIETQRSQVVPIPLEIF